MKLYKERFTLEQRTNELQRIRKKYPDRVPVILQKAATSRLPEMAQFKFLVPDSISMVEFLVVMKKRIKLEQQQALFLFINNTVPMMSCLVKELYEKHKDEDGFLYINYTEENTFG
jgi:GABA(A) receptor-associated protein